MINQGRANKIGKLAEKAFKEAVKKAIAQHRKMGIPAVYMQNGKIVYLMPNGKVVSRAPNHKSPKKYFGKK